MKWEIIAKLAGGGMTYQAVFSPYDGEPPDPMLKAVTDGCRESFRQWTGREPETVVVTSAPVQRSDDPGTLSA